MSCLRPQSLVILAPKELSSQPKPILKRPVTGVKGLKNTDSNVLDVTLFPRSSSDSRVLSQENENPGSPAEYRLVIQQSPVSQLKLVSGYLSAGQAFHSSTCKWLRSESLLNILSSPYKGILLQYLPVTSCSAEFGLVPLLNSLGT